MARTALFCALAGAMLLAGCVTDGDTYQNRTYVSDGWAPGPYYGERGPYYGSRAYYGPRPYYGDADRYYRSQNARLVQPERRVVCDRATQVCYKSGDNDASETKEYFGNKAARRVDRVRDHYDNNDIFLPRRNVVCNDDKDVCYKNGRPDRSETRNYFGKKAARRFGDDD